MIWNPTGTTAQRQTITDALARCDFPFDLLTPSLAKEGKSKIDVDWSDLSTFGSGAGIHTHNVRGRTLGLFYLPPNTRVVMDLSLSGEVAHEVFLSEAAHAVDYHYMTNPMRLAFWNAVHGSDKDLPEGTVIPEEGDIGHGHSWFEGPMGYNTWVGEAWMAGFVKSFSNVPITINLQHFTDPQGVVAIRKALLPLVPNPDTVLAAALRRFLKRGFLVPGYLRTAANTWLRTAANTWPEVKDVN